jgi:hypothetical protein
MLKRQPLTHYSRKSPLLENVQNLRPTTLQIRQDTFVCLTITYVRQWLAAGLAWQMFGIAAASAEFNAHFGAPQAIGYE